MTSISIKSESTTVAIPVTQYVLDNFDDDSNVDWMRG